MNPLGQPDRGRRGKRSRDLPEIRARRRELVERAADQRQALAESLGGLSPAFAAGDRVVAAGRFLASHPLLVAGAGALLVAFWPRRVFGLAARGVALAVRGFTLWNGARSARRLLAPRG